MYYNREEALNIKTVMEEITPCPRLCIIKGFTCPDAYPPLWEKILICCVLPGGAEEYVVDYIDGGKAAS
jgi:hypothetical protein